MIPSAFHPLADHLWQSTWLAGVAGLFTLALRKNRAQTRYWLWLAASMKFLLPFSLLVALGTRFGWRAAPEAGSAAGLAGGLALMDQVSRPFAASVATPVVSPAHVGHTSPMPAILVGIWAIGFLALMAHWWLRWRSVRVALRSAARVDLPIALEARTSPEFAEPGVFGIARPVLLLPEGVEKRLTAEQWEAVLRHELCHVRRRDNLATAMHMMVERVFWFHPLVWWLGGRMVEERERACDEEVLRLGSAPEDYAEGILTICELYLESPLPCVAGVRGANLKQRIEAIMSHRAVLRLNVAKKAVLAIAGMAALLAPVVIGVMNAPARAQEQQPAARLAFDSASVKVNKDPDGGSHVHMNGTQLSMVHVTLKSCIMSAFDVNEDRLVTPAWMDSERYDITAKAVGGGDGGENRTARRLQTLLKERFKLAVHTEMREAGVYELVVAKNGPKMKLEPTPPPVTGSNSDKLGVVDFTGITMDRFAKWLARPKIALGRSVVDKTGLTGMYTFRLHWSPEDAVSAPGAAGDPQYDEGAAVIAAMQEQLGLKLEARKGMVQFLVVDHAEKVPTEN